MKIWGGDDYKEIDGVGVSEMEMRRRVSSSEFSKPSEIASERGGDQDILLSAEAIRRISEDDYGVDGFSLQVSQREPFEIDLHR
ncbi:hypothetical protein AVEN_157038-1 [Araneus ventricosus]|uniref:Uncharacterized protein n=1 Tax=Araneus ventricosus TaxID=182803 RepID=A0A4Y2P9T7_ARAVE|nr:hypothetical protein AVEN_157038-1 [Araneus ventricosus]